MATIHQAFLSFNGGELTPYLAHRTDFEKHPTGAARMENLLPMPFGGVRKRPGTLHLDTLDGPARLAAFQFTDGQVLMQFGLEALVIRDSAGDELETISYEFTDPFALQFAQVNDIVFIADPHGPPLRIIRDHDDPDDWTLEPIPFNPAPYLTENLIEEATLTVNFPTTTTPAWANATNYAIGDRVTFSGVVYAAQKAHTSTTSTDPGDATTFNETTRVGNKKVTTQKRLWLPVALEAFAVVDQSVSMTSNFDIFTADHVGARFRISKVRALNAYEVELAAPNSTDGTSQALVVQGSWAFNTFGTWDGTFFIDRSTDNGTNWTPYRSYESSGDRNVAVAGDEPDRVLMRLRWVNNPATNLGSGSPRGILSASSGLISGDVEITSVTDARTATAMAITPVEKCTTARWREGAFSNAQGWPAAIGVHERRLIFAGTTRQPLTLWMSRTDDLLSYEDGTDDDSAVSVTLAAVRQDPIRWIASQKRLLVGTAGGEWVFGSENSDEPVTPSNLVAREHTNYGSAAMPSIRIGDAVHFIERQGRRLREFAQAADGRDNYEAADLTRLAEHITESGITQWAWQPNREPFVWAVRADGTLISFAYHRPEKIAAWARHTTAAGGKFRSIAVLRNATGDDDIFLVVERAEDYHLERFAPGQQAIQEAGNLIDAHFVDAGIIGSTDEDLQVAVPEHLEGETLAVLADGVYTQATVEDGKITLIRPAEVVHAGLPIHSALELFPIDLALQEGATHGRRKRAHELLVDVFKSFGGSYTYDGTTEIINYTNTEDNTDSPPALVTGWRAVTLTPAHMDDLIVTFDHTEPMPFILRGAVIRWQLNEP